MVTRNPFQHSVLHYQLQTPSVRTWFYVYELILEAHKAKINWSIGCNQDLAEGDFRKDSNGHFAQQ